MLKEAFEAGQNDDVVADIITEHGLLYFQEVELPEDITDDERDLIMNSILDAYAQGVASCYSMSEQEAKTILDRLNEVCTIDYEGLTEHEVIEIIKK